MKAAFVIVLVLLLVVAAAILFARRRCRPRHLEIAPASELQEKYGLFAENRPEISIQPERVLKNLRDLIPLAEKWGIGDDIIREDFENKASREEKEEFKAKLKGRTKEVTRWLDSFAEGSAMSDEAGHFMHMLQAMDEMGLWYSGETGHQQ